MSLDVTDDWAYATAGAASATVIVKGATDITAATKDPVVNRSIFIIPLSNRRMPAPPPDAARDAPSELIQSYLCW
jgi:hypothetical protein